MQRCFRNDARRRRVRQIPPASGRIWITLCSSVRDLPPPVINFAADFSVLSHISLLHQDRSPGSDELSPRCGIWCVCEGVFG